MYLRIVGISKRQTIQVPISLIIENIILKLYRYCVRDAFDFPSGSQSACIFSIHLTST